MAVDEGDAPPVGRKLALRRSSCVPAVAMDALNKGRAHHRAESTSRQLRVLTLATRIGAAVSVLFGFQQFVFVQQALWIGFVNLAAGLVFLLIPKLYRYGDLLAPLVFILAAYTVITVVSIYVGTSSGLHFYYVVAASLVVLVLGIEHMVIASALAAVGAVTVIALEMWVPHNTGVQPDWAFRMGFVINVVAVWVFIIATVWFAMRETARAEEAMEIEYQRSESLLANILPASIAKRLKDPAHNIIADRYDDASILFADIAGYTKRASDTPPTELVRFLDALYTDLDALVDRHGLEKVKTSGDSYMVVSGVPEPRPDHLEALASLALDMADAVAGLTDPQGREVPLRIGVASGPVVAGVVGARKFFYDVWGDAVNVAARMESTDVEGRIQVPDNVYQLLSGRFEFEERGEIDVKGKGMMQTWYLTGRR
ncbi:adenylate/guanylate cyclase domain-containing protein [Mycobacterium sp. RTGN4]|uniref:adenylate/guanylate cyclase domain-containing protein n=1 Tax=unclassified Mycobacterium TaxID=2642494 RepID=UPI0039AF819B